MTSFVRFLLVFLAITVLIVVFFINGSLPLENGSYHCTGLSTDVCIKRDKYGNASILAKNRLDAAMATGFLHAQERFFQMDLLRRTAAGELAELLGKVAIDKDKTMRMHRFRAIAERVYLLLNNEEKALLFAYSAGINKGIAALKTLPFEYGLLLSFPKKWEPLDSILVGFSLFIELEKNIWNRDLSCGKMNKVLPSQLYDFLVNNGSCWEATFDGEKHPIKTIPAKDVFLQANPSPVEIVCPEPMAASNSWAIAGKLTGDHRAILANDMHLNLQVPNVWYRLSLKYYESGKQVFLNGVTLPGLPCFITGSNGHIAWGFTTTGIDTVDYAIVNIENCDPEHYWTKEGVKPFNVYMEQINVKGGNPIYYPVRCTIWGPLIKEKFFGASLSMLWTAHFPQNFNFQLLKLEKADSVKQALMDAKSIKIPLLNFIVADDGGNIGWTLIGSIPNRKGYDGSVPISLLEENKVWDGFIEPEEYPVIENPDNGYLWIANNRPLGKKWNNIYGSICFANSRSFQIEQKLKNLVIADEAEMLNLQLDTSAIFFDRWQKLIFDVLKNNSKGREDFLKEILLWNHQSNIDSRGYFLIRVFRTKVIQSVLHRVLAPCYEKCPGFQYVFDGEESVWQIIKQRPDYLKNQKYKDWEEEFLGLIDEIIAQYKDSLKNDVWGNHNKLKMRHPLSSQLFCLKFLLDMPEKELSGDFHSIKVAYSAHLSSERMVVSPGHENQGFLQTPGGQSGNPFSKNYSSSLPGWLNGDKQPFLPGSSVSTLILKAH